MRKTCPWSGETYWDIKALEKTEDGRHICPHCGKAVKMRKHPASGTLWMIPRHNRRTT